MSIHTAYEVRVRRNSQWRVEAIFDDEVLALAAAKTVETRAGRTPVVVIHEIYDSARNHLKSRSVYRSAGSEATAPGAALGPDSGGQMLRPQRLTRLAFLGVALLVLLAVTLFLR